MTDPAPWIKYQEKNKVHIIGSFENVHGERYVIWRNENGDIPYFTGDELDWEPKNRLWPTDYMFNEDERAQVAKLLFIVMGDLFSKKPSPPYVTYNPELEQRPEMIAWRKEHNIPALSWDARHPAGS
jgi:hypothetical protein